MEPKQHVIGDPFVNHRILGVLFGITGVLIGAIGFPVLVMYTAFWFGWIGPTLLIGGLILLLAAFLPKYQPFG